MHPRIRIDIDESPIMICHQIRPIVLVVLVLLPHRVRRDSAAPPLSATATGLAPPYAAVQPLIPILAPNRGDILGPLAHLAHSLPTHLAPGRDCRGSRPARQPRDVAELVDRPPALHCVPELD